MNVLPGAAFSSIVYDVRSVRSGCVGGEQREREDRAVEPTFGMVAIAASFGVAATVAPMLGLTDRPVFRKG